MLDFCNKKLKTLENFSPESPRWKKDKSQG